MQREDVVDLNAFVAVAEHRSFTRAAAKLGTSQSALSYAIRRLETRIAVRLLTRTTRSVSPTEAGERLLRTLRPAFDAIDAELASLTTFRDKPSGIIRINAGEHAIETILWPALESFLTTYADVVVEAASEQGLVDIVSERFDAGIRLGEQVAKDMIAVPVGPDLRMAVVATPAYCVANPPPATPDDLVRHRCINLRLQTSGGLYAWEFEKDGRELKIRVEGQLVLSNLGQALRATLAGFGVAFLMEDRVQPYLASGQLVRMLEDWCPPFPGYHLYYPSRRQPTPAFSLLVEALRYRSDR